MTFDLAKVYPRLMAQSAAAFAAGRYETAYHLLMAALHCAADAGDAERLAEVARACREQQKALDGGAPNHRLSSRTARQNGHAPILEMGATTAEAAAKRLKSERLLAEAAAARRAWSVERQALAPPVTGQRGKDG